MSKKKGRKEGGTFVETRVRTNKRIIGYEKERKELKELGEMLKNVEKYHALGIRIPRGLVLYGDPGVGKSVMANSIAQSGVNTVEVRAGEICSSGAEETIHASFKFAKEHAPCVLILDELDKIAGTSFRFFMQQNSDVNKILLQELDKLSNEDAVLVVATCNATDCLGDALLRPGRFDRQIHVLRPDEKTRKKIFRHYFSAVKIECNAEYDYLAKITYGKTPADIECIVNESAIYAVQNKKSVITVDTVRYVMNKMAFDGSPEDPIENQEEEYRVAVHEAGHTLVALNLLPDSLFGASIIPQGTSGGHVEIIATGKAPGSIKDKENEIAVAIAGRIAEREILGETYLGSESDFHKAMKIAYNLLTNHGVCRYKFLIATMENFQEKVLSDQSRYELESQMEEIFKKAEKSAIDIIKNNRNKFDRIVKKLTENKILSREELLAINNE